MKIVGSRWKPRPGVLAERIYIKHIGTNGGGKNRARQPIMKTVYWYMDDEKYNGPTRPITRYRLHRDFERI